jgi:hypothetical protein
MQRSPVPGDILISQNIWNQPTQLEMASKIQSLCIIEYWAGRDASETLKDLNDYITFGLRGWRLVQLPLKLLTGADLGAGEYNDNQKKYWN